MDLNELLYHHQMALMAVGRAQRDGRSIDNFDLPWYFARRINEYRERRGLTFDIPVIAQWGGGPANCAKAKPSPFVGDLVVAQRCVSAT